MNSQNKIFLGFLMYICTLVISHPNQARKCKAKPRIIAKTNNNYNSTKSGMLSYVRKEDFPLYPVTVYISNKVEQKENILKNFKLFYPKGQKSLSSISRAVRSILYKTKETFKGQQKRLGIHIVPNSYENLADADLGLEDMRVKEQVFNDNPGEVPFQGVFVHEFTHLYQIKDGCTESIAEYVTNLFRLENITCQNDKKNFRDSKWDDLTYCDGAVFFAWVIEKKGIPDFVIDLNQRIGGDENWKESKDGFYNKVTGYWKEYQDDEGSSEIVRRHFEKASTEAWNIFANDFGLSFDEKTRKLELLDKENVVDDWDVQYED